MRVALTRPAEEAARSAARLRELGHEVICAPLMRIVPVAAEAPRGTVQAVALTSAAAAREAGGRPELAALLACRTFPVGRRTARAAEDAGFSRIERPAGDGEGLLAAIRAACAPGGGEIVHLAGRDVAVDVAGRLGADGFAAERLVVYEAQAVETLPRSLRDALREERVDAVLVYSARSARLLVAAAVAAGLGDVLRAVPCVAISAAAAEPLRQAGHSRIALAGTPDEAALLAALETSGGRNRGSP